MYSPDFRRLAVRLFREGRSYLAVSKLLRISTSTVHRWVKHGHLARKQRPRPLSTLASEVLRDFVSREPVTTHARMLAVLRQRGVKLGLRRLSLLLRHLGLTRKRTSKRMSVPAKDDGKRRIAFEDHARRLQSSGSLVVCIDECCFSEKVLPSFGYSPAGQKCVVSSNSSGWRNRSLLLAVACDGSFQYRLFDGAVNSRRFADFVLQLQYPPRTTVVLDNASFHRRQMPFVAKGYWPMFTPPYSPEHNSPVEHSFSVVKRAFRKAWPWPEGIDTSIERAVRETLTQDGIAASFRHWWIACEAGIKS